FYSNVRDLIQTIVLPDTTTQTQNVGNGHFSGAEVSLDLHVSPALSAGANYTLVHRTITDALQPNLRPVGVPTHKAFLYAMWKAAGRLTISPSLDLAGDRWSDVNPAPAFPYVRTGAYALLGVDAAYAVARTLDVAVGSTNLLDDNYQLAWGFPQQGRTFYV